MESDIFNDKLTDDALVLLQLLPDTTYDPSLVLNGDVPRMIFMDETELTLETIAAFVAERQVSTVCIEGVYRVTTSAWANKKGEKPEFHDPVTSKIVLKIFTA